MKSNNSGKVTVVWGGQFGSEGKGEVVNFIAQEEMIQMGVRVGGPNAGHTFHFRPGNTQLNGEPFATSFEKVVVQTIPIVAMLGGTGVIGPAGCFLLDIMDQELKRGLELLGRPVNLLIDGNAAIINRGHMASEAHLKGSIGSTGEGVGAATAAKVMRDPSITAWADICSGGPLHSMLLLPHWADVHVMGPAHSVEITNRHLLEGRDLLIEGTQGYSLSLHTSGFYPFCTSRECTPMGLYSQTGVNPNNASMEESVMVLRTFPIRVGGNSGPIPGEITWEELRNETGGYVSVPEITTVTKKTRRIARFDPMLVKRAVLQCSPTCLAITFMDYLFPELANDAWKDGINHKHWAWIDQTESELQVPIKYLSFGPGQVYTLF